MKSTLLVRLKSLRSSYIFILVMIFCVGLTMASPANAQYAIRSNESAANSTDSLSSRERAESSGTQNRYDVSSKDLSSYPTRFQASVNPDTSERSSLNETEGEKIHRYFGVAIDLYRQDRFEEAIAILKYLNELDPSDEYIRSYLLKVQRDSASYNSKWQKDAIKEAAIIKKDKISTLISDGIDSFEMKDYDTAVIRFFDVLDIDPKNATAQSYIAKLKEIYSIKIKAEEALQEWSGSARPSFDNKNESVLPVPVKKEAGFAHTDNKKEINKNYIASDVEMRSLALKKRAESMLEDTEFGSTVDAIVSAKIKEGSDSEQLAVGPGDVLKLFVLNHPELSGEISVQSGGELMLPLTGDTLVAHDISIGALRDMIKASLSKYVQKPQVLISVAKSQSQRFYVIDEVSCTPYPLMRSDTTLRDALFISDWGNNRALGRVILIRPSKTHPIIKKVDAFDLIFRGNLANDVRLKNGDVIYVPMTYFAKFTKMLYDTMAPFRAVKNARDTYLNMKWNEEDYQNLFRLPHTYETAGTTRESGEVRAANANQNYNVLDYFLNVQRSGTSF